MILKGKKATTKIEVLKKLYLIFIIKRNVFFVLYCYL